MYRSSRWPEIPASCALWSACRVLARTWALRLVWFWTGRMRPSSADGAALVWVPGDATSRRSQKRRASNRPVPRRGKARRLFAREGMGEIWVRSGAAGNMHRPAGRYVASASSLSACAPFWLFRLFAQRAPTTHMSGLRRVWHGASFRPRTANVAVEPLPEAVGSNRWLDHARLMVIYE